MFNTSVSFTRFSAGSGINDISSRVQKLESMIEALESQKQRSENNATLQPDSFKAYLGNTTPPPKLQPLSQTTRLNQEQFQPLIEKYAQQYGIDPALVTAVIRQESGFNPNAVSHCGARGLMQLMPATAKGLGVENSFDPEQNIAGGVKFLSGLMAKYNGNIALALAAYNAGGGAVDKYNGIPPYKETQNYVRKILAAYLSSRNA